MGKISPQSFIGGTANHARAARVLQLYAAVDEQCCLCSAPSNVFRCVVRAAAGNRNADERLGAILGAKSSTAPGEQSLTDGLFLHLRRAYLRVVIP